MCPLIFKPDSKEELGSSKACEQLDVKERYQGGFRMHKSSNSSEFPHISYTVPQAHPQKAVIMNKLLHVLAVVAGCTVLIACGGEAEDSTVAAEPAASQAKSTAKPANNPLASQQQLLKDAKGVQALLDQNAEKKKKALNSAD
jgi:hypothetical protein|tara:strand:+ start:1878 stop:2306 length:429 start_codon:yes stop_codon:yes gene_type:complete